MAGTHKNYQDMKKVHGLIGAADTNTWIELTNQLPTRRKIVIVNTGVSYDSATACRLDICEYQTGKWSPGPDPDYSLFAGDQVELDAGEDISFAVRGNTANQTYSFIEYEALLSEDTRDYD